MHSRDPASIGHKGIDGILDITTISACIFNKKLQPSIYMNNKFIGPLNKPTTGHRLRRRLSRGRYLRSPPTQQQRAEHWISSATKSTWKKLTTTNPLYRTTPKTRDLAVAKYWKIAAPHIPAAVAAVKLATNLSQGRIGSGLANLAFIAHQYYPTPRFQKRSYGIGRPFIPRFTPYHDPYRYPKYLSRKGYRRSFKRRYRNRRRKRVPYWIWKKQQRNKKRYYSHSGRRRY